MTGLIENSTGMINDDSGLITKNNDVGHLQAEEKNVVRKEARTKNHETFPYLQSKTCHNSETNPKIKIIFTILEFPVMPTPFFLRMYCQIS